MRVQLPPTKPAEVSTLEGAGEPGGKCLALCWCTGQSSLVIRAPREAGLQGHRLIPPSLPCTGLNPFRSRAEELRAQWTWHAHGGQCGPGRHLSGFCVTHYGSKTGRDTPSPEDWQAGAHGDPKRGAELQETPGAWPWEPMGGKEHSPWPSGPQPTAASEGQRWGADQALLPDAQIEARGAWSPVVSEEKGTSGAVGRRSEDSGY